MKMHLIPSKVGFAAENMQDDLNLLQNYPDQEVIRFRHYEWKVPAFTYGRFQQYEAIEFPSKIDLDSARRPTAGGIVDHQNDWTYSLVIPPNHFKYRQKALSTYLQLHKCVVNALGSLGCKAIVCQKSPASALKPSLRYYHCFNNPILYDVVDPENYAKIAGAAQKRSRDGFLIQGSIDRSYLTEGDWIAFYDIFVELLLEWLGVRSKKIACFFVLS